MMKLRIVFDENGRSSRVNIVDSEEVPVSGDFVEMPDGNDIHYIKEEDGTVRPMTVAEVQEGLPYDVKRRVAYHPIGDQLDSLYKTLQGDPAYDGTELAAEIAHWQSVKDLHPKP